MESPFTIIFFVILLYMMNQKQNAQNARQDTNDRNKLIKDILTNPALLVVVGLILVVYYVAFHHQADDPLANGLSMIELLLWCIFVFLLLLNGITHLFQVDVIAYMKELLYGTSAGANIIAADTGLGLGQDLGIGLGKEVFHVSNNTYDYETAKTICAAYDARLANFKEVDEAYAKGGEWCSYGWSEGQMALYPTQYEKWNTLQTIKGHENDCGHPGINGGYMANPQLRFGVNCYGSKPAVTTNDLVKMQNTDLYPKSLQEAHLDEKVRYWRKRLADVALAPFNHSNWSVL